MNAIAEPTVPGSATRPDTFVPDDPAIWYGGTKELTEFLIARYPMDERNRRIVGESLAYLDRFYATRRTENVSGEMIPVTTSPISSDEGRALLQLAIENGVRRSLEIGFSFGMSTSHLLVANHVVGGDGHTAIDPFQLSDYYQGAGLKNIYNQNLGGRFGWIAGMSNVVLPSLLEKAQRFDLVFIDGSHLFSDTFIDAYYAYQLVPVGGLIVFDDKYLAAVRTVMNILRTNFGCVDYPYHRAKDFGVMVKTATNRLDWTKFDHEFVPFRVED
ncbi:MAG: hypothetical protein C0518_11705 [Opitutus sp.]|nr:hypothetical protein [Opitutus sp.]